MTDEPAGDQRGFELRPDPPTLPRPAPLLPLLPYDEYDKDDR